MLLLGLICGGMFGLGIAAIILTSACKIARVRPPNFFPAMGICLLVILAGSFAHLLIAVTLAVASGSSVGVSESMSLTELQEVLARSAPIALCLQPFISAGIFSVMLENCSFGRGFLVWLAQLLVVVVIGAALLGIAYGVGTLGAA